MPRMRHIPKELCCGPLLNSHREFMFYMLRFQNVSIQQFRSNQTGNRTWEWCKASGNFHMQISHCLTIEKQNKSSLSVTPGLKLVGPWVQFVGLYQNNNNLILELDNQPIYISVIILQRTICKRRY